MTTRQKMMALAGRLGCKVEYVPRQDQLPAEILVDAPDGKSFDGELTQLVCWDWTDALARLSGSVIVDGEPD